MDLLLLKLYGGPELTTTVLNRLYGVLISSTGTVGRLLNEPTVLTVISLDSESTGAPTISTPEMSF